LDFSDVRHVSDQEFPNWTKRVTPRSGDLVLTYEATLHRYAIIPDDFVGCLGRRVALIRPDPTKVDSRYLLYYFLSFAWRRVVEASVITGATVDRIPLEKLPDFPVQLPSLETQRAVAEVLGRYDDLIANNQRRIELLEQSVRLLFKEWFVRFRFPGHEHVKVIDSTPEGWKRHAISDIWAIKYGKNLPTDKIASEGTFPVHGADAIIGYYHESNVDRAVCLVTSRGAGAGNIRRTFGASFVTNNAFIFEPLEDYSHVSFFYAMFALESLGLRELRTGAAQPQLTLAGMNHLKIVLPTTELVESFNMLGETAFRQIDNMLTQNARLAKARDLLLPRLMDGRISV
jgi:type I restriction enzyme S subunit